MSKFYQCENFYPFLRNPQKYLREDKKIVARSGLEQEKFRSFDSNPNILAWNSENIIIPYNKPIFDGAGKLIKFEVRKYYVDVYLVAKNKDIIEEYLAEIKPLSQVHIPVKPKRKGKKTTKNYLNKMCTWYVNMAKWTTSKKYADMLRKKYNRNIDFIIITEKDTIRLEDVITK
jgi:hypothetical protein